MSLSLFRLQGGIDIQSDDLSSNVNILQGTGIPGGDAGQQDAAPIGSIYLRADSETDGLQFYWKYTTINNSSADWKQGTDKDYVDAVAQGLSWREPVRVMDTTSYADSSAFPTTGTVDGVSLNNGDRVLFSNVTLAGDNNVFIWDTSGSPSAWVEDTNEETDGDATLIQEGTYADRQYIYNGTSWILFGSSASVAELGYIRTFIGKTGPGAENPTYSSTDVITQTSSLETAIGDLDDAMGSGEITNDGGNYALSDDMSWGTAGTLEITDALDELNEGIGDATFTSDGTNINNGDSTNVSIDNLNEAIIPLQQESLTISGTQAAATLTTMDTLAVADATEAKWLVQVRQTGTPANRQAVEIHALTDGTLVDHTEYAVLKLGSSISTLDFNVAISGTDMILTVNSTAGVDYVVRRIAYTAF